MSEGKRQEGWSREKDKGGRREGNEEVMKEEERERGTGRRNEESRSTISHLRDL